MTGAHFPSALLAAAWVERLQYFKDYTVSHPRLVEADRGAVARHPGTGRLFSGFCLWANRGGQDHAAAAYRGASLKRARPGDAAPAGGWVGGGRT